MAVDRIYMDSCCFIESVKSTIGTAQEGRDGDLWYIKQLLKASKDGSIEIITSYLTLAESRHARGKGITEPTDEAKRLFRSILCSGKVVKLAQLTRATAELARDLHWDHGINLGGADAIHVATALKTGCKEFLSFDAEKRKSPLKYTAELKKLGLTANLPSATKLLPQDYRQEGFFDKNES